MMAQLLAHLWGDYILQSDWMALNKRKANWPCAFHATFYAACFLPLMWQNIRPFHMIWPLWFIAVSHFYIDRYGLARYVVWAKNWIGPGNLRWSECKATGYPPDRPIWLTTWLLIIADNTLHLTCNYIALRWL